MKIGLCRRSVSTNERGGGDEVKGDPTVGTGRGEDGEMARWCGDVEEVELRRNGGERGNTEDEGALVSVEAVQGRKAGSSGR